MNDWKEIEERLLSEEKYKDKERREILAIKLNEICEKKGITSGNYSKFLPIGKDTFLDLLNGKQREYGFRILFSIIICLAESDKEAEELLWMGSLPLSENLKEETFYLKLIKTYCTKKDIEPLKKLIIIEKELEKEKYPSLYKKGKSKK